MIQWIETNFTPNAKINSNGRDVKAFAFKIGDLENGVRDILDRPQMPESTLRTHISNLRTGRYISSLDPEAEQNRPAKSSPDTRNVSVAITRDQLNGLLKAREVWDSSRTPQGVTHRSR